MRVVVAMSGGVDSSVAAGLMMEAGHEVVGLTMKLRDTTEAERAGRVRRPAARPTTCSMPAAYAISWAFRTTPSTIGTRSGAP
jgi:tRNA U34 2-thiouridine synthase MnmA/TrmU